VPFGTIGDKQHQDKQPKEGSLKMANLIEIEGVGETYAQKLMEADISTTEDLLEKGASPQGRKEIAEKTDISGKLILEWVNHVDLFRIKGVGEEYADLLEEAGVDTVPELAQRNPENLYQKLVEVNQEKKLVRQLPGQAQVKDWIEQAKQLPRKITY
jgi:predicted flap endonuclease-1-like 5' DNA nuclease